MREGARPSDVKLESVPLTKNIQVLLQAFQSGGGRGVVDAVSDKLRRLGHTRPGNLARLDGASFSVDPARVPADIRYLLLSGKYEQPERDALRRGWIDRALPVVEFGACIGVVSCIANAMLADPGNHVVVEANPAVLPLLNENRRLNGAKFHVVHAALGYGAGETGFNKSPQILVSSTRNGCSGDSITVPAITLQGLLDRFGFEQCSLLCDVEGAEDDLVRHESEILARRVKTIIMEIHDSLLGRESVSAILSSLAACGFEQVFAQHETRAFRNSRFPSP
jgi:FkbM family methyltransferase